MRLVLTVATAALLLACGRDTGDATQGPPGSGRSAMDEPHVVFTKGELTITRLEAPVHPPVTASSRPGPATLRSDDSSVVAVDEQGRLIAHSAGATTLRSRAGQGVLRVTVVAPDVIRAEPGNVVLEPRGGVDLIVRDGEGAELPRSGVVWNTSAPNALVVVDGRARSLGPVGSFELTASVGDARAVVPVTVSDGGGRLAVTPLSARIRRGDVMLFRAAGPAGQVVAEWRSDDPKTLSSVAQGLFQAMRPGRARACARSGGRETCSEVEVTP